jgi:NTP pyrophosphatase (non-canonical NTP hydrolase)
MDGPKKREPLRVSDFEERVRQTDEMGPEPDIAFLGLFGEIGSLVSALKKRRRDKDAYFGYERAVLDEVGDVLWYASAFARRGGTSFAEAASRSIGDRAPPNQVTLGRDRPVPRAIQRSLYRARPARSGR